MCTSSSALAHLNVRFSELIEYPLKLQAPSERGKFYTRYFPEEAASASYTLVVWQLLPIRLLAYGEFVLLEEGK